jgi:hypothetical protein
MIGEGAGEVGADFHFGVGEETCEVLESRGILLGELADAPEAVESANERKFGGEGFLEPREGFVAALGEGELGAGADALVIVREEVVEFFGRHFRNAFGEEVFDFENLGVFEFILVGDGVDAAVVRAGPAAAVVGDVEAAVGGEVEIGCSDSFEEPVGLIQGEGGSLGLEGEAVDAAIVGAALVADDEEMLVEGGGQGGDAGVVGKSAGAVDGEGDGRDDVGGLAVVAGLPKAFVHPDVELLLAFRRLGSDVVEDGI